MRAPEHHVGTNLNKLDQFGKSLPGIWRELILDLGSPVVMTKAWYIHRETRTRAHEEGLVSSSTGWGIIDNSG